MQQIRQQHKWLPDSPSQFKDSGVDDEDEYMELETHVSVCGRCLTMPASQHCSAVRFQCLRRPSTHNQHPGFEKMLSHGPRALKYGILDVDYCIMQSTLAYAIAVHECPSCVAC